MSVKDMIKKSVLESDNFVQSVSWDTMSGIIINMLLAVLLGVCIYLVYKKFYNGVIYSRSYALTLVGMTCLTCMVTLAISTNIVISLGMVGAGSSVYVLGNHIRHYTGRQHVHTGTGRFCSYDGIYRSMFQ